MVVVSVSILNGCATNQFAATAIRHPATGVPDHFLVGVPDSNDLLEPKANDGCRNPMVDPRNGNRLQLVRSSEQGQGDYAVSDSHYGVGRKELLRIDCSTGKALGIVKK